MTNPRTLFALCLIGMFTIANAEAALKQMHPVHSSPEPALHSTKQSHTDVSRILSSAPTSAEYPDAAAANVLDSSDVTVLPSGVVVEKDHEMLRIFNDRARSEGDIAIPYTTSTDVLTDVKARTILPNGNVVVLNPADIHTASPFSGYGMYDDSKVASFSMPGVQDGSIIDYSYTITHKPLMPNDFSELWQFGDDGSYPVKLSRFQITAPNTLKINSKLLNGTGVQTQVVQHGDTTTYVWSLSNISDIDREPMMPPDREYLPMLQVSSLGSWQDISHWYWNLAKDREVISPELHQVVLQQTAGKTSDEDKAKALFYWVEQNIRYVAVELGQSAWQPHAAQEVYLNRYGDCKDMATLLVTLLHDAGISDAYPVLLHAESTDPVEPTLPSTDAFDHCIARATINGKDYWFDCTAEICGFGQIPGGDRGANVLVVKSDGTGEFNTVPPFEAPENSMNVVQKVVLNPDGSAVCNETMVARGDGDMGMRGIFRSIKPNLVQDGIRSMVSHENADSSLINYQLSDVQDRDTPFSLSYSYSTPDLAQKTGNLLLYTPNLSSGGVGDFTKPTRKFPIYTHSTSSVSTSISIQIPDGYKVDDLPEAMSVSLPFADYVRSIVQDGQTINISFQVNSKPSETPADQYSVLQTELAKLRATIGEPIVLKKSDAPVAQ